VGVNDASDWDARQDHSMSDGRAAASQNIGGRTALRRCNLAVGTACGVVNTPLRKCCATERLHRCSSRE
jgi:hypothetical protein